MPLTESPPPPELPPIREGRTVALLRRLVALALQRKLLTEDEAQDVTRWIDSQ